MTKLIPNPLLEGISAEAINTIAKRKTTDAHTADVDQRMAALDTSDGKITRVKKRKKKTNPLGMTDHKKPAIALPSRSSGLPSAVMLPIGARPIKKPFRSDIHAGTPIVADRTSMTQVREEIVRLQAHRARLRGEIRSRCKRNLPDQVLDRTMMQFAQATGKLDYLLNLVIKAGAETATPVTTDNSPITPAYSDTAIGDALRQAVKTSNKPFTKTILPDGKAEGLSRSSQVAKGARRGRGGSVKSIPLPFPESGLLSK